MFSKGGGGPSRPLGSSVTALPSMANSLERSIFFGPQMLMLKIITHTLWPEI